MASAAARCFRGWPPTRPVAAKIARGQFEEFAKLDTGLAKRVRSIIAFVPAPASPDEAERLLAKVQNKVDEQFAKLEAKRQEAERELLAKLGEDQQLISQIAAFTQGQLPVTPGSLPPLTMPPASVPQLGKIISTDKLEKLTR